MKYILLVFETPDNFDSRKIGPEEPYIGAWRAYYKALAEAGAYVGGAPLKDVATATTVRLRDGKRHVQDGPYAEAKEQLGGFLILDLPSEDSALEWAARCPAAATGRLEVRPMDVEMHDCIVKA